MDNRVLRVLTVVVVAAAMVPGDPKSALADDGSVSIVVDRLGRFQVVIPRQHASVVMAAEKVVLVPFYDQKRFGKKPVVLVNARFDFQNPADAQKVLMGFPEMQGARHECSEPGMSYPGMKKIPYARRCSHCTGGEDGRCRPRPLKRWHKTPFKTPNILRFAADIAGKALAVKALPGKKDYRRWFVFEVPMAKGQRVSVRNVYVARLGFSEEDGSGGGGQYNDGYYLDYVLHTGATWAGVIGKGEIRVRTGLGRDHVKRFNKLEPTRRQDIHRPLGFFNLGYNGKYPEPFAPITLLQASSTRSGAGVDSPALARDQDPTTAWVDGGKKGGVGQWLQLPAHCRFEQGQPRCTTVRGVRVQGGAIAGVARIKQVRVDCHKRYTNQSFKWIRNRKVIGTFELPDSAAPHVIRFRRRHACAAVRLVVKALHGAPGAHAAVSEVDLLYR